MSTIIQADVGDVVDKLPSTYGLRQVDLKYKLVSCHTDLVAVGTESDVIVCYDRRSSKVTRIVPQGWKGLTALAVSQSVVCWGTSGGHVGARDISTDQREDAVVITGPQVINTAKSTTSLLSAAHQHSVTTIALYGNTVYSADSTGVVMRSDISWLRGSMAGLVIHSEGSKVNMLKPINNNLLLVGGLHRAFILEVGLISTNVVAVGRKERKAGEYGCCVVNERTVLVCRPGYRLWVATVSGQVLRTIQLRPALTKCEGGPFNPCTAQSLSSCLPKDGVIHEVMSLSIETLALRCGQVYVVVDINHLTVIGWYKDTVLSWSSCDQLLMFLLSENVLFAVSVNVVKRIEEDLKEALVDVDGMVNEWDPTMNNSPHLSQVFRVENSQSPTTELVEDSQSPTTELVEDSQSPTTELVEDSQSPTTELVEDSQSPTTELVVPDTIELQTEHSNGLESTSPQLVDYNATSDISEQDFNDIGLYSSYREQAIDETNYNTEEHVDQNQNIECSSEAAPHHSDESTKLKLSLSELENNIDAHLTKSTIMEAINNHDVQTDVQTDVEDKISNVVPNEEVDLDSTLDDTDPEPSNEETIARPEYQSELLKSKLAMDSDSELVILQDDVKLVLEDSGEERVAGVERVEGVEREEEREEGVYSDSLVGDVLDWYTGDNQSDCGSMMSANSELPELYPSPELPEKSKLTQLESMTKGLFTLSPSPAKPRQLIRSEIMLPNVEPDKISMSSQETMSNNSSIFDEDETIAVRIRKRKPRVRKANFEEPSVQSEAEILSLIEEEKVAKNRSEESKAIPAAELETVMDDTAEKENMGGNVVIVKDEAKLGLDINSILDGLAGLNTDCLDLDVLGLPHLQSSFEDEHDSGVEVSQEASIDFGDQSTILCETSPSNSEPGPLSSTPLAPSEQSLATSAESSEPLATSSESLATSRESLATSTVSVIEEGGKEEERQYLYSESSLLQDDDRSSTESEDEAGKERGTSVEMGEDPLSWQSEGFPDYYKEDEGSKSMLQLDNSCSDTEVEVSPVKQPEQDTGNTLVSADNWVELRGPTVSRMYVNINMVAVSNISLWCIDSWGHVYCSPNNRGGSIEWRKVPGKLIHIDVSDSGYVVWGISSNKRAVVRIGITPETKEGVDWSEMMLECSSVSVDDRAVWLSMLNSTVWFRYGITEDEPQGEKWIPIPTPNIVLSKLSVNNNVVWAVSDTGKLVIRTGISGLKPLGSGWEVMPVSYVKECHVGRLEGCAWVVDTAGVVHFQCGVTQDKPKGSNIWWQVSVSEHLSPLVSVQQLGLWTLSNLRKKALEVKQVCTSSQGGVWLLSNSATLHCRHGNIAGHNWANVSRTYIPGNHRWRYLVAGGANESKLGPVWGLTFTGDIICFTRSQAPACLDTPVGVVIECIGASVNVLWALDNAGQIHIRGDMSDALPFGTRWEQLDMVQLNKVMLKAVWLGVGGVWAVDSTGAVWYRTGVTARTHSHSVPAWCVVDSNIVIKQIVVGGVGWMVWGLDIKGNVYMRNKVSLGLPVGEWWEPVPGVTCHTLSVSGTHVYGVTTGQQIVCRYGISLSVPAGNYWRKLPGPPPDGRGVRLLSSTLNNSLWCEVRNGTIYRRRTKTIVDHAPRNYNKTMDEDWEVL